MSTITIDGTDFYVDDVGLQVVEVADQKNVIPFDELEQAVTNEIIELFY